MTTKKSNEQTQQLSPVRIAPLGELTAYTVHEHELDVIAAGSPATLAFNLAVALIPVGVTFIITLTTTTISSDRLFYSYLIVCVNCWLVGSIALIYWLRTKNAVDLTVAKIKSRLVVTPAIQEAIAVNPATPAP